MKAKTFENLLRRIVREEIDYSLRRELKTLKEDLRDEIKPTITEQTERLVEVPEKPEMSELVKNDLRQKIMGSNTPQNIPKTNHAFTQNPALNDLLNETAQGNTNTVSAHAPSPINIGNQPFNSPDVMPVESMPPSVAEVVNKDYRELVKVFNKKSNRQL
tara:strand:- start:4492 stop:4971 length:480 start_codon:yes stop_codon:yes gene_type:complete